MSKGGKGGSSGGQSVNPMQLAQAQTQSNVATAGTQASLNNINTYSPYGSSTYQPFVDPTTGQTRYSLTQALDPASQNLFQSQTGLAQNLVNQAGGVAGQGIGLQGEGANVIGAGVGALGQINPSLAPYLAGAASPVSLTPGSFQTNVTGGAGGQPIPQVQTGVTGAGQGVQGAVGPAGPIQTSLSPEDFGTQIKQAQDAAYQSQTQYLDPQFNQQEETLKQNLADQGISEGSDAYTRATGDFNRQKQMAYQSAQNSAVAAGNQQQQALFSQQLQSGQFANTAQAQNYVQQLQDAGFINAAQAQTFGQQIQSGQFANQAQQQVFGQGTSLADLYNQAVLGAAGTTNQAAQLGLQRAQAEQQTPVNTLAQLLQSGGNVYGQGLTGMQSVLPFVNAASTWPISIPTMGGTPATVAPTNYAGVTQAATGQNQLANTMGYQSLNSMLGGANTLANMFTGGSSGIGGLFGAGGLGSLFSGGAAASAVPDLATLPGALTGLMAAF
jgi:hypothetical protein